MSLIDFNAERHTNPVDMIERVAGLRDWSFERSADDEITISQKAGMADYDVSFAWMEEMEAIHLSCAFDLKVSEKRKTEVMRLLSLVNEQMWIGHFDLWSQESLVMFRQTLLLAGGAEPTEQQVEGLLASAVEACERYYQAFQFVVWAGKSASEALGAVLFETAGEA